MKSLLLITFVIFCTLTCSAQKHDTLKLTGLQADTLIFAAVAQEPDFPGGMTAFAKFLKDVIKPTGDKGRVYVSFIVEKDGSLSRIEIARSLSQKADKASTEAISKSPKWKPGLQNGKPVRVEYTVPVVFN